MGLWNKLLNIGVHNRLLPAEIRKVRLVNGILLIGEILLVILIIKSLIQGATEEWVVQLLGAIIFPVPIILNYFRKHFLAKIFCLLIPFFYLSFLTIFWGSDRGSQMILFACSGLAVLFFDDKKLIYGMIALGSFCLIAVEIYNFNHDPYYYTDGIEVAYIINVVITIIMLTVISTIFRRENEKYQKSIQDKNTQLTNQHEEVLALNKKLEDTLDIIRWQTSYAKTIQDSILPLDEELQGAFRDYFVFFKPKDVVSGDFYFYSKQADKKFIAAIDCTGHGVPGAFMSLIGYNLLLEAIELNQIYSPAEILKYVEERIQYALKQDQTLNKDGIDIALCCIDEENKELVFAGAKNPLLIIKRDGKVEKIKGDYYSVGGIYDNRSKYFTQHRFDLTNVDTLYLFSDGYQDQFGGEDNRKFMSKRFREMLISLHDKEMSHQQAALELQLNSWRNGAEQTDDILVMGLKV